MQDLAYIVRDAHIPFITKDAKHILWHLASREGDNEVSWPSTRTMSLATNISQKGVQRALNCLVAHGLIVVESGKQFGRPNHYRVTLPPEYIDEWYEKHKSYQQHGRRARPKVGQRDRAEVGQTDGGGQTSAAPSSDTVTDIKETNKSNKNNQEKVSQLVSMSPAPPELTHANATLAMNKGGSPKRSVDKDLAKAVAYSLGMPQWECEEFWVYNQARGWPLLETMSLEDNAKAWRASLNRRCPSAVGDELKRRREEARQAEEREFIRRRDAGEFD